ncbi:hypothetical protein FRX31_009712 [Thalictrum thalictroides]|uniref:Uncharacterized protein n=1 Tax=Thalictrum thalictroides TaxID=46969 RepID=A0A7J6WTG4_THATH|nr:hypothetical protein FRX31_009712 [Thalictrum thalictroides]
MRDMHNTGISFSSRQLSVDVSDKSRPSSACVNGCCESINSRVSRKNSFSSGSLTKSLVAFIDINFGDKTSSAGRDEIQETSEPNNLPSRLHPSTKVEGGQQLLHMVLSALCCTAASWIAMEVFQQKQAKSKISAFILTPQFLLFGAMDGLARDGIKGFFSGQLPDPIKSYAVQQFHSLKE